MQEARQYLEEAVEVYREEGGILKQGKSMPHPLTLPTDTSPTDVH